MAKMTDDELIALIDYGIGVSVGFTQSKLSKERERWLRYRNGELPGPAHKADSTYVSRDVYESVESMKAQLLETFSAGYRPVWFVAAPGETDEQAMARTDVVSSVIMDQNDGFLFFQTMIGAGLMNRNSVCKVWWDETIETEYRDFSDVAFEDIAAVLAQHDDAKIESYEKHEDGQSLKRVRVAFKKRKAQVRIEALPPEQFGISPMAESIKKAELVFHRRPMTVSDLIKHGFDPAKVKALQDNDRIWYSTEPELLARFEQVDDLIGTRILEQGQPSRRTCMVYECYLEIDPDDSGVSQLYQVMKVGDTILSKEPVSYKPFVSYCPLPREFSFWGDSFAELMVSTQLANTYLTRSIVNHALITNNPRTMVAAGGVKNPRELIENRFGGVINVRSVTDSVAPFPQSGLNPFVYQTLQMLQQKKEELTGISQLSQGLNKDAVSKQNSADMVQELITVSQVRQKVTARNFADGFLRELYTLVHQVLVDNADPKDLVRVNNAWTAMNTDEWPDTVLMEVSFHLGYGEQDKEAQKWVVFDKYMESDPELKSLYPLPKRFNVLKKIAAAAGIRDVTQYMLLPTQVQPPPPNPMMMAELAVKQADAKVKLANASAAETNTQLQLQEAQIKAQLEMAKLGIEKTRVSSEIQLKQDQLAHKVAVDAAEIALEQQAQAMDKLSAVAEPTRS